MLARFRSNIAREKNGLPRLPCSTESHCVTILNCCVAAKLRLWCTYAGCKYNTVRRSRYDDHLKAHQGIKDYTDWPTIPQLYVKGEFVGGCDITREMYETGELQQLLDSKGIGTQDSAQSA